MTECCPGHDPILYAGIRRCHLCGQVCHPIEAEWLDTAERLLALVSWPVLCAHFTEPRIEVLDIEWLMEQPEVTPQCASARRDGQPCRARPAAGTPWCQAHGGRRVSR